MFYENNTHHTLFIYMWDGEQDLNDKLVTFNMTWPCYVYYVDNSFYRCWMQSSWTVCQGSILVAYWNSKVPQSQISYLCDKSYKKINSQSTELNL